MTVEPYDEVEIAETDRIIRRVSSQYIVIDENGDQPRRRLSSALYSKSSGRNSGMSVDIEALIIRDGVEPSDHLLSQKFMGCVAFLAGRIRALDLMIGYEEIRDDPDQPDNPYHGEVWTKTESRDFSRSQKRGLRDSATWYFPIEGVDLK